VIAEFPGMTAATLRELDLTETPDRAVFLRARDSSAVIVTKDADFVRLVRVLGPPPQVVWVRTGNLRTAALCESFGRQLKALVEVLDSGAPLVVFGV
jgi:predicted nuclease of predicted toxin-antitoxin system